LRQSRARYPRGVHRASIRTSCCATTNADHVRATDTEARSTSFQKASAAKQRSGISKNWLRVSASPWLTSVTVVESRAWIAVLSSSLAVWLRLDSRSKGARPRHRPRSRRRCPSRCAAYCPRSTRRGTASFAPPSACARIAPLVHVAGREAR
jgi:hypothetical protein